MDVLLLTEIQKQALKPFTKIKPLENSSTARGGQSSAEPCALDGLFRQSHVGQKRGAARGKFPQSFTDIFRAQSQDVKKFPHILEMVESLFRRGSRFIVVVIRLKRHAKRSRSPGDGPVNPQCSFTCDSASHVLVLPQTF